MIRIGQLLRIYQQTDRWAQPINRWSVTDYGLVNKDFYDKIMQFQNFKWPENKVTLLVKNLLLETPIPNLKKEHLDLDHIIEMHYIHKCGLNIGDAIKNLKAKHLVCPDDALSADFEDWEIALLNFKRIMLFSGHRTVWEMNFHQKNMKGHMRHIAILGEQHLFEWPISCVIKRFFLNIYCNIKNLFFDI